jgi:hypothetical protein
MIAFGGSPGEADRSGQDLAHVAAHVLTGKGKHGFSDKHRGQLMVLTGKILHVQVRVVAEVD